VNALLLFIGDSPGEDEDKCGEPFTGTTSETLMDLLEAAKIPLNWCYFTNTVMCRPPEKQKPTGFQRSICWNRLYEQIYLIDPLVIVTVGKEAMSAFSWSDGRRTSIQAEQGRWGTVVLQGKFHKNISVEYTAIPIFHPAYISRTDTPDPKTKGYIQERERPAYETFLTLDKIRECVSMLLEKHRASIKSLERNIRRGW